MAFPDLPADGVSPWGDTMRAWADAVEAAVGTGSGVEEVSGVVTLPVDGARLRQFYTTGAATINGETFAVDTALVARRTAAGVWQVAVVDTADWRAFSAVPTVTATAPMFTDEPGTGSDTYTIPAKANVIYKVAGAVKAAGTYPGSGTVTVTAEAASGYVLTGTASWTHTFSAATSPIPVTAQAPTWTDDAINGGGSWSTPTIAGATYSPASGTATPGQSVTVTATAQSGYSLTGTSSWTHEFPEAVLIEPPSRADIEQAILADSPVIYLPLQGDLTNSGSITGATLTPVGSPTHSTEMPDGSLGLAFASGDKINSTGTGFTGTGGLTAEVVAVSSGGNGYMVGNTSDTTPQLGTSTVGHKAPGDVFLFGSVPTGEVFHLAMTYDGQTIRRYFNGQLAGETDGVSTNTSWPNIILGNRPDGVRQFVGIMRDVALYPTMLTPARILAHAQAHGVTP